MRDRTLRIAVGVVLSVLTIAVGVYCFSVDYEVRQMEKKKAAAKAFEAEMKRRGPQRYVVVPHPTSDGAILELTPID